MAMRYGKQLNKLFLIDLFASINDSVEKYNMSTHCFTQIKSQRPGYLERHFKFYYDIENFEHNHI